MKHIASSANPGYKSLHRLARSARERSKAGVSLLDGAHLVTAYLEHVGAPERLIVSDAGRTRPEIRELLKNLPGVEGWFVSDAMFRPLSSVDTPTGLLAVVRTPAARAVPANIEACVLLDDVQDPGNVGSILRSTAAAGVRDALLSKGAADVWSPRALRAGMGAHFMLRISAGIDLVDFISGYGGSVIVARQRATRSVFDCPLAGRVALVFGNEGSGVSAGVLGQAHEEVEIPMPGKVESLNVAAAAAICLFERVRQSQRKNVSSSKFQVPGCTNLKPET